MQNYNQTLGCAMCISSDAYQEAKPVFAVVEPATVPLCPSGTGKKAIILGFIFLTVLETSAWILFGKELRQSMKQGVASPEV